MIVLGTQYIDSYNYFQAGYDILRQSNNQTTYRRYITLTVVSGGHVSWGSGSVEMYNPYYSGATGTNYYGGTYTLGYQDITVTHQPGQPYTAAFHGKISTSYGPANWEFEYGMTFPAMDTATSISSFNGDKLKGDLNATFTPTTGYTYKLKISLNGDDNVSDTYDNYVSGTNVRLSSETIAYIQNKIKDKNVTLKATLISYKSGTLIGQTETTLTVSNTKGLHLRINGVWKEALPYVRVNGVWKEAIPYIRNNQWKEGI